MEGSKESAPPVQADRAYKKKRVEEIGSTLAQIRAMHKAKSRAKRDNDNTVARSPEQKSELVLLFEEDKAKAVKLEKERPKIKEAIENLKIDREQQKIVEKKIEETLAKQAAPLPEVSPEVLKRMYDMEMTIHNLKETIGEKDKVLSSKTESLKMLNEQLSHRSSEFREKAEGMRKEISLVKDEFSQQEEFLKSELDRALVKVKETTTKLTEKEKEYDELNGLFSESKQSTENLNKLSAKLKAQLKAIKTDRDSLKKELSSQGDVESLQNRIALLEEEKGNLQLQLVDFDEIKETNEKYKEKADELLGSLEESRRLVESLLVEKSALEESVNSALARVQDQDGRIRVLEERKISAEMRAVELEESLENDERLLRVSKLEKELENLQRFLREQEETIVDLTTKLDAKELEMGSGSFSVLGDNQEHERLQREVEEWQRKFLESEDKLAQIQSHNTELQEQLEEAKRSVKLKEGKKGKEDDQLIKKIAAKLKITTKQCQELEVSLGERDARISSLEEQLRTFKDAQTLENDMRSITASLGEREMSLRKASEEITALTAELDNRNISIGRLQSMYEMEQFKNQEIQVSLEKLEAQMGHKSEEFHQLIAVQEKAQEELRGKEGLILALESSLEEMRRQFDELQRALEARQTNMEEEADELYMKLKEAENLEAQFEKYKDEMAQKMVTFKEIEQSLLTNIEQLTLQADQLKGANTDLTDKNNELELNLKDMKSNYNTTLDQIEILNEDLKQVMNQFESRNQELMALHNERRDLQEKLLDLEDSCGDLQAQLREAESHAESLKGDIDLKAKHLDQANQEIMSLQAQLCSFQFVESKSKEQDKELEQQKAYYDEIIHNLQQEKEDLIGVLKNGVAHEVEGVMEEAARQASQAETQEKINLFTWTDAKPSCFDETKDEEDGWGWIAQDRPEQHSVIQELSQKVHDLEEERSRLSEDLKASQIKCTKLMKKAKDVMMRNEELEKAKARVGFDDLDFALQEELRSQIDKLEAKNKELTTELTTLKAEKEKILKKIDVVESANEQLVEMKERQDIEVQMWQKRSGELANQIQGMEWELEELRAGNAPTPASGDQRLALLAEENEQLQRVICNLKDNPELKKLKEELDEKMEYLAELEEQNPGLRQENNNLQQIIAQLRSEVTRLESLIQDVESLKAEVGSKTADLQKLQELHASLQSEAAQKSQILEAETAKLQEDSNQKSETIKSLQEESSLHQESIKKLSSELDVKNEELRQSQEQSRLKTEEESQRREEILQLQSYLGTLQEELGRTSQERVAFEHYNAQLQEHAQNLQKELERTHQILSTAGDQNQQNAQLQAIMQSLQEELSGVQEQLRNSEAERLRLTGEVESVTAQLNSLKEQEKESQSRTLQELEQHRERAKELEATLETKFKDLEEKTGSVESLKTQIDRVNEEAGRMAASLVESEGVIEELRKENGRLQKEWKAASESANVTDQVNSLKKQLTDESSLSEYLKSKCNQQEDQVSQLQMEIHNLRLFLADLNTQLDESKGQSEIVSVKLKSALAEKDRLASEVSEKAEEIQTLLERVTTLTQNNDELVKGKSSSEVGAVSSGVGQADGSLQVMERKSVEVEMLLTMVAEKDAEIERLEKLLSDTHEMLIKNEEKKMGSEELNLKRKLDDALYSLHQSDVRCEELTHEIMQLLEERDTLQLRLSEILRENEELRVPSSSQSADSIHPTTIEFTSETPKRSGTQLHDKLGELHYAYKKDPSIKNDRESRHSQQMQLYTEKTPTKDDMNTSGDYGLFNWFFGTSPQPPQSPKPAGTT